MKVTTINAKILKNLTVIKLLINGATKAVGAAGVQRAFAVLHAHDALDWTLQIVHTHLKGRGKKNVKMFLIDYAHEIDKYNHGLVDLGNVSQLNTLRNNFKHDFLFPDPEQTRELIYWTENQINTIFQRLFNTTLSDIDLVSAIENGKIKTKITEADKQLSLGKTVEAYCSLSIAFEMIKRNLQEMLEKATGKKVIFETDFSFSNSFFLKIERVEAMIDSSHNFAKAWDQIINSTEYLVDMSFINFLGVGVNEYFQFQAITPRPRRTIGGQYHCDVSDKLQAKMMASEYQKSRDFVVDTALKAQSKIL